MYDQLTVNLIPKSFALFTSTTKIKFPVLSPTTFLQTLDIH